MTIETDTSSTDTPLETTGGVVESATTTPVAVEATTSTDSASAAVTDGAPKTLVEAMFPEPKAEAAKPADGSAAVDPALELGADGKPLIKEEAKPDAAEDLTKMPEGLAPKAQERFQRLANENKDVRAELDNIKSMVEPFRATLQENKVTSEQFGMAAQYMGLINKGDLRGALAVMDRERKQLAVMLGEPLAGVDALADYPDLRQAVELFQVTEQHAMELAKSRRQQDVAQQRQQQTQVRQQQDHQRQQSQQQEHQAFNDGVQAVDKWSKEMAGKDLDYPHIEKLLQEEITGITTDLPPHKWVPAIERLYKLAKAGASSQRTAAPTSQALRPTGAASPGSQPKTLHEAMWGGK